MLGELFTNFINSISRGWSRGPGFGDVAVQTNEICFGLFVPTCRTCVSTLSAKPVYSTIVAADMATFQGVDYGVVPNAFITRRALDVQDHHE